MQFLTVEVRSRLATGCSNRMKRCLTFHLGAIQGPKGASRALLRFLEADENVLVMRNIVWIVFIH